MALKETFMVKSATYVDALEVEAKSGESILIKDIIVWGASSAYAICRTGKSVVGYFRIGGLLGNHLFPGIGKGYHSHDITTSDTEPGAQTSFAGIVDAGGIEIEKHMIGGLSAGTRYYRVLQLEQSSMPTKKTILGYLTDLGIFKGYPISEGEKFEVKATMGNFPAIAIVYEVYDAGDIKKDMENGSEAKRYFFINYGRIKSAAQLSGDYLLEVSTSPAEFPDFPFGKIVPAKTKISIHGILASCLAPSGNNGTNYTITKYLKFIRERKTLFDEMRNGIIMDGVYTNAYGHTYYVGEGFEMAGNYSDVDPKPPLIFPSPLIFNEGEELNVYWTLWSGGTGIQIIPEHLEVGLIETVEIAE
jgi:hypothetical protein